MVIDAWCFCLRAWSPVWQIFLFGMSEYSAMMAGIMRDGIGDVDAKKIELRYPQKIARVGVVDAACGPEPETPVDQRRKRDPEKIERAFPVIDG